MDRWKIRFFAAAVAAIVLLAVIGAIFDYEITQYGLRAQKENLKEAQEHNRQLKRLDSAMQDRDKGHEDELVILRHSHKKEKELLSGKLDSVSGEKAAADKRIRELAGQVAVSQKQLEDADKKIAGLQASLTEALKPRVGVDEKLRLEITSVFGAKSYCQIIHWPDGKTQMPDEACVTIRTLVKAYMGDAFKEEDDCRAEPIDEMAVPRKLEAHQRHWLLCLERKVALKPITDATLKPAVHAAKIHHLGFYRSGVKVTWVGPVPPAKEQLNKLSPLLCQLAALAGIVSEGGRWQDANRFFAFE